MTLPNSMYPFFGNIDRIIRAAAAVAALIGAFVVGFTTAGGIVLTILAVLAAATAAVGFCPLYRLLGMSTSPRT